MYPERLRDGGTNSVRARREEVERYVYDLVSWCTLNWTTVILLNSKTVKRRGRDMTGRWNEVNCPWKEAGEEYNGVRVLLWHSEGPEGAKSQTCLDADGGDQEQQETAHLSIHWRVPLPPVLVVSRRRVLEQDLVPLRDVYGLVRHLLPQRGNRLRVDGVLKQLRQVLDSLLQVPIDPNRHHISKPIY